MKLVPHLSLPTAWFGELRLVFWHARRDSNPRPSGSKPDALSPELRARGFALSEVCAAMP